MSRYTAEYNSKLATVDDVLGLFKNGYTFATSVCAQEPNTFFDNLHRLHGKVEGLTMLDGLTMREHPFMVDPQYKGLVNINSNFMMGPARKSHANGMLSFVPGQLHAAPLRWMEIHDLNIFVGMATPMDDNGYMCMSLCLIHDKLAFEKADIVVIEVNPNMPRVFGDTEIHIRDVDYIVEVDTPLPILPMSQPAPEEMKIGEYVASLINDGDTIQLGIGGIPDAVSKSLADKHDLGVHTELITNGMIDLIEAGVITGRKKTLHKGKVVATFAMGEARLYEHINNNPSIMIMQGTYTNDPWVIRQNDNMVSVNTALSVDITGQICSESIGPRQYSGVGGQCDTAVGAIHAKNGRSIIALRSTKKKGTVSSIVSTLAPGSVVSLSRNDIDYIVTEYGIAPMRGRSIKERVDNLIAVAHPDFRAQLRAEAQQNMQW